MPLLRGADLLHFRWDVDARSPWRGVSPLTRAGIDAQALAAINGQLRGAGNAPHGYLMHTGQFGDEVARKAFDANLRKLRGNLATVDRGDINEPGGGGVTGFDLLHQRMDQGLELTRRDLADSVVAACGIPPALLSSSVSGGVASREAWRQLGINMHGVGRTLAEEIRAKLGESVTFDFSEMRATTYELGRARTRRSWIRECRDRTRRGWPAWMRRGTTHDRPPPGDSVEGPLFQGGRSEMSLKRKVQKASGKAANHALEAGELAEHEVEIWREGFERGYSAGRLEKPDQAPTRPVTLLPPDGGD